MAKAKAKGEFKLEVTIGPRQSDQSKLYHGPGSCGYSTRRTRPLWALAPCRGVVGSG